VLRQLARSRLKEVQPELCGTRHDLMSLVSEARTVLGRAARGMNDRRDGRRSCSAPKRPGSPGPESSCCSGEPELEACREPRSRTLSATSTLLANPGMQVANPDSCDVARKHKSTWFAPSAASRRATAMACSRFGPFSSPPTAHAVTLPSGVVTIPMVKGGVDVAPSSGR